MRPGSNVTGSTALPPTTPLTSTGTWFAVGYSQAGPSFPVLLTSFAQFQRIFGGRGTYSATLSDAVETFFSEGGSRLYFCRAIGSTAVKGTITLKGKGTSTNILTITASSAGVWGNALSVVAATVETTKFQLTVKNGTETVETSPVFASYEEAIAWSKSNNTFVVLTSTFPAEVPLAETVTLVGGTNIAPTTVEYEAALKSFKSEFGPGQVSVPGVATKAVVEALFKIASEQKRRAVADAAAGSTESALKAEGEALRAALGATAKAGAVFASWQSIPGLPGVTSTRYCPESPFIAAKCSAIDAAGNPNLAPAGRRAVFYTSLGQETTFSETETEALYTAGINVSKSVLGQVRAFGNRTLANTEPLYLQFSNVRLDMAIEWKALSIEEGLLFGEIDGLGTLQAEYGNKLSAMLLGLYQIGALFGLTAGEAFSVDAGSDVNTIGTEAEGNLNANIACKRSPGADSINLNLTRVTLAQEV